MQSISINSKSIEALFNLGVAYLHKKKLELAEETFIKALQIDPDFGIAYASIGSIYLIMNKTEEAIPYLLKSKSINQGDADLFYNLALVVETSAHDI